MDKDALIVEIGKKLSRSVGAQHKDWVHLALVTHVDASSASTTGFAYDKNGKHKPFVPRDFDIGDDLEKLQEVMAMASNGERWCACLMRLDRSTGEIDFDFEYENADRWSDDMTDFDKLPQELRPAKK